jgi:hypothetical protein
MYGACARGGLRRPGGLRDGAGRLAGFGSLGAVLAEQRDEYLGCGLRDGAGRLAGFGFLGLSLSSGMSTSAAAWASARSW